MGGSEPEFDWQTINTRHRINQEYRRRGYQQIGHQRLEITNFNAHNDQASSQKYREGQVNGFEKWISIN